ncbi:MAG: tRNA pseudouridine(38-40) synthase TruA [Candidatus Omnitrophica bacterium]|nr:tRNA pseudouridine(38-40) synthase TruA [Candidatus Omnitrophota bacterium]
MRNLKLEIEYDGTHYCGWQIQGKLNGKKKSIQAVLEDALRKILNEKIQTIVSGRTDAGVHALAQVANFKTKSKIPLSKLRFALNDRLPKDISISSVKVVPGDFHSRFDAKSKIYRYTILNRKHPSALLNSRVYFCRYPLDLNLMRQEARVLKGRHNFKSFQARDYRERNPVKTIKGLKIRRNKDIIQIDIEADGFLYNMVRNIAGTLVAVGRGKFPKGSMKRILEGRDRKYAGQTISPAGLCLVKAKY